MDKTEAIYEFINRYVYFVCAANIVIENYTMSDAEDDYKRLVADFTEFIEYYDKLSEFVDAGKVDERELKVLINAYIDYMKQKSIGKFVTTLQYCVDEANDKLEIDIKKIYMDIQNEAQEKKTYQGFTTNEMKQLLKRIREHEENDYGI